MNVTEAQRRRHEASDDSAQTHRSKPPTAEDLHRQAETRQRAHAEGASSSDLARKTQSGASWRKRLEQDIVSHLPDTAKQIVRRAVIGYGGDKLYARGCDVAKQIKHLPEEQLKDILGMVNAGTPFGKAMAHEQAELKRPVAYVAPKSLKAQTQGPIDRAKALSASVAKLREHAANTWMRIPVISRDAELQLGLVKSTTAPIETFNAVVDAAEGLTAEPLKKLGHEASVTKDYLSGTVTQLQARTRSAYFKLQGTLESLGNAANDYLAAMSKTPPDVLTAEKAATRANAASKLVDAQVGQFYALADQLKAANKEFDHQVPHVVKEVLITAASLGLGMGLAAEASDAELAARKAATKAEKALHVAEHLGKELATDRAVGKGVEKLEKAAEDVRRIVERH
ncbi:MAG: hypothetical protein AB7K71_19375 [Polyangiaceae bacterium]